MHRTALEKLKEWKDSPSPQPLLFRGARQIGKSFLVSKFAEQNFDNLVTLNFEEDPELEKCFKSLDPQNIIEEIAIAKEKEIIVGKTLLFLDEIQICPRAIMALRYFYEKMPGLHVIAAGSLLEFVIKSGDISIPVGRVQYFFMQPLSFYEYLYAVTSSQNTKLDDSHDLALELDKLELGQDTSLVKQIKELSIKKDSSEILHAKLNEHIRKYFLLGGMPKVLKTYLMTKNISKALDIQRSVITTYRDDFGKYAKLTKHKYLQKTLYQAPKLVSKKFKYSFVDSEIKTRELQEAFELLQDAGVIYKVKSTSGAGVPLEAGASEKHFKATLLDIGLMQSILGLDEEVLEATDFHSIAAGALAEQFVAQELLASENIFKPRSLYYWEKDGKSTSAEVDYLINVSGKVIPIEVKAGTTGKLISLRNFMKQYKTPFGVRISQKKLSFENGILSIPFYAVAETRRLVKEVFKSIED